MLPTRSSFVPFVLAAAVAAQGMVEHVVPGHDFVEHKLLTPGLTDTWKLDAEQDEMLLCSVSTSTFDPVLELVDERGTVLGRDDGAGTCSELWLRVPAKGKYEFHVSPFKGSGGGQYEYRLHRFRTQPLGVAAEATHTFGAERWWHYRVALKQGDVLVPTVLGDGRLTAVLDAGRNVVPDLHGGFRATRDGDYFVRIEGPERGRCQVLTELARRASCELGERRTERIAPYGFDTWLVRLPAGACIVFDLRTAEASLGLDVHDQEPTRDGPGFVPTGNFDKGGMHRLLYFVRRDCTLEAHVRHGGSAPAPYELCVRRVGDDVAVGATIAATLPLGDGALFHVPLQSGELVDVLAHSEQFDANLDVWDPDGNVIANADDRSPIDRDAFHRFLVTRPGTYHLLVHCIGGRGSGAFTLRTTTASLPLLAAGSTATVQPGAHLHLELQANEVVWFSLRSSTFDGALQVVDPTGDGRFVAEGGGIGGDVLTAYRCSHAGRHTLIVHARSGSGDGELKVVRP